MDKEEKVDIEENEKDTKKEPNEELTKVKEELEDIKDRHTRLIAEFDNLKKRSAKEREGLYASIMGDIICITSSNRQFGKSSRSGKQRRRIQKRNRTSVKTI